MIFVCEHVGGSGLFEVKNEQGIVKWNENEHKDRQNVRTDGIFVRK